MIAGLEEGFSLSGAGRYHWKAVVGLQFGFEELVGIFWVGKGRVSARKDLLD